MSYFCKKELNMANKLFLLVALTFGLTTHAHAQNKKLIDSLSTVFNTAKHDTTKIMALCDIAYEYRTSKPDTCIALATQALEKSEKIGFDKGKGWASLRMGTGNWVKGNYPEALGFSQKALSVFEKIQDKRGIGGAFNNIGNIYLNQGNYPLALEYYQKSLKIKEEISDKQGIGSAFNNIGNIYLNQGNYPEALGFSQKALFVFEKIQDKRGIGGAFNNIGNIYLNQGNYPLALEYYQKSLKIKEEISDKQGISYSLNNIGLIYNVQGNYPLALEYYQKSLKISEEISDKQGISYSLNNIGNIYRNQGNEPLALEYYQKSLKIREEIGDKRGIGLALNNIGNIYEKQGNYPLALEYQQKSLKIREEIGDKWGKTYSLNGIAAVYQKQKDYDKSIEYAQKSLQIAQEIKALKEVGEASKILFNSYKLKGDYIKALEYHELYKQSNDSLFNVDKSKAITNLEAKAEIEKKEKEIAIFAKDKELDRQKQEVLSKDLELQRIEGERQKNAKLAIEQQAKADILFALARHEQDKRKQDSLTALAQKTQLLANNLKVNEQKLQAESKAKELEIEKEKGAKKFQQYINYLVVAGLLAVIIFAYFIFKSRRKAIKVKEIISLQAEQLTEANNSKDKLFAILGHDLRSPVASLEGFLNLMQMGVISTDEFQTHLPVFYSNVKNVQNTLDNLLQWSISQMNGINAQPVQVNTQQIIGENINLFTAVAKAKNITFVANVPGGVFVWADENHFRLLLRNLINNAIKFTPEGGQIKVATQQRLTSLEISITDNGVGMTGEQTAKLFQKNQNMTTQGTSGEKGTGLGLQLCQEIVAKNGGAIWANSTKGEGSTFTFSLPMATA